MLVETRAVAPREISRGRIRTGSVLEHNAVVLRAGLGVAHEGGQRTCYPAVSKQNGERLTADATTASTE